MPATTLLVQLQHQRIPLGEPGQSHTQTHTQDDHIHVHDHDFDHDHALHFLFDHDHVRPLNTTTLCQRDLYTNLPTRCIGTPLRFPSHPRLPRPLMATLTYSHDAQSAFGAPPGSPPDLTNSKSSKSSSFHSSTLSDLMGPSDLSHFEDINLNEVTGTSLSPCLSLPHSF